MLNFNDTVYDGPDEVRNGFAEFFKELGQPKISNNFYESHKIMVEADMAVLEGSSTSDAGEDERTIVSNQEVQDALDRLKPGKAMDKDSIAGEHLIYAKDVLVEPLVKFFNAIFKQCHIPSSFLESTIKPIWKKKGSKYRGITITSTLGKVFEDVLTKKIEPFFLDTQSELQFGFTSNTSILAATLLLNEALTRERSRPKLTAVYLDAEKAFDMVWQRGLLKKLALLGIPKDLWSILMKWYSTQCTNHASVSWQGETSEAFQIHQGVIKQGGKLSPLAYKIFINDLLLQLEDSPQCLRIGPTLIVCPTIADDVLLLSSNNAQELLHVVNNYTNMNRYSLNAGKSAVVRYHGKNTDDEETISLNDTPLPMCSETTHLGILQGNTASLNKIRAEQNVDRARRTMYSLLGTGLHGCEGMNPITAAHIVNIYVMPRLIYGAETWCKATRHLDSIKKFHDRILKIIQGLPTTTANVGALILLGCLPSTARIHQTRLALLWNAIQTQESYLYNVIQRQFLAEIPDSWTHETCSLLTCYQLPSMGELLQFLPSKSKWKSLVKEKINSYWKDRIVREAASLPSLKFLDLDMFQIGKAHPVWTTSHGSTGRSKQAGIRAKLLMGAYTLQGNLARFNQNQVDPTCKLCKVAPENRVHFLGSCPILEDLRRNTVLCLAVTAL